MMMTLHDTSKLQKGRPFRGTTMSTITPGLIKKSTKYATKHGYNVVYLSVSIKHGLQTTECGMGIKYGLGIKRGLENTDWV